MNYVLISLFNGISNFASYLMPKSPVERTVVGLFNPREGDKGVCYFPRVFFGK